MVFSTTSLSATSLSFFETIKKIWNYLISNSFTSVSRLFKQMVTDFDLSISNLSTSDYKLANQFFRQIMMYQDMLLFSHQILLHS